MHKLKLHRKHDKPTLLPVIAMQEVNKELAKMLNKEVQTEVKVEMQLEPVQEIKIVHDVAVRAFEEPPKVYEAEPQPEPPKEVIKQTLDNNEVMELCASFDVSVIDNKIEEKFKSLEFPSMPEREYNILNGLLLKARETAVFTITTNTEKPIKENSFFYSIKSFDNAILSAHLIDVQGNKCRVLINNLNNKDINFSIQYECEF